MTSTVNPDLTQALHDQMPLSRHNQLIGLSAEANRVVTQADWQAEYCGIGGVLHGGYLMAMADGTGATLAFVNLEPGQSTTTVESKTNFFRPVTSGSVRATATLVHKGRSTIIVQTDIATESGALVSRTLQTQMVRQAIA